MVSDSLPPFTASISPTNGTSLAGLDLGRFPPIECVIGYGSGVFKQAGYASSSPRPMVDLVFVVGDADVEAWHRDNMTAHPGHYSGLARAVGCSGISRIQRWGPGIYYNPHVLLPTSGGHYLEVKYGVVSLEALLQDLRCWSWLYLAGRLQKPFVVDWRGRLTDVQMCFHQAVEANRRSAFSAALLLAMRKDETEKTDGDRQVQRGLAVETLLEAVVRLSYDGDIRVGIGEDPRKVQNILKGQQHELLTMYSPIAANVGFDILGSQLVSSANSEVGFEGGSIDWQKRLFAELPCDVRRRVADAVPQTLTPWTQVEPLRSVLRKTVRSSSLEQTAKGILTAGVSRAARYAVAKLGKRLK
eukprot:TRINITY_DN54992_c0_g1_i1.p1 TRINITY_DN54992_c0_g1~~TRINITY_DN54992_c0_g1_i1.p1  ORF type:complete len:358 (+),score=47.22 TRINITY_DN54992_c0_g1_i1:182-1255(+)